MELDGWARNFQPEQTTTEDQSHIANHASPPVDEFPSTPAPDEPEGDSEDSEADVKDATDQLLGSLRGLCIRPGSRRYFGKSSGISLLRTAITIKSKAANGESPGAEPETQTQRRHDFWCLHPVSFHELYSHVRPIELNPLL